MTSITTKFSWYLLAMTAAAGLLAACSSPAEMAEPPSAERCSSLINTKCVRCHYKTRICDALGSKDIGNWQRTVNNMQRQGAQLTEDEQDKAVACLDSLPRGSDIVCR